MSRRLWSEGRRRVWRWGWAALVVGVFLCPVSQTESCPDAAGPSGGACSASLVPLMGSAFGYAIPAP